MGYRPARLDPGLRHQHGVRAAPSHLAGSEGNRPMRRAAATLLVCTMAVPALTAADLALRIRQRILSSPAARSAFWGILVVDQATGKSIFEMNPGRYFVPASNTKLFTTALALSRLGPDYTFRTAVRMDRAGSIRLV